jgi:hypothetical protein
MNNQKIPAFTLMEVVISMLIAAIAISITFTAYQIVSGSYGAFTKKQNRVAALAISDKLLKQDFIRALNIERSSDGIVLHLAEGEVSYIFTDTCILRDQFTLRIDTFKVSIKNLSFLFEGQPGEEGARIDQLGFQTELDGMQMPFQYHKTYSAQDLFK